MESIIELGKFIQEVATFSEEQRQGVQQINIAVSELDTMTQENAGLVEKTVSASKEMMNQAKMLQEMMEKYKT